MRLLPVLLVVPSLALAEGRGVTVLNGAGDTIREIHISPAGSSVHGPNRLRSTLPPKARAHIGYSTGCRADIRLGFDGRTEEFLDQDTCSDLLVTAGQGATAASASRSAKSAGQGAKQGQTAAVFKPAPVEVPPWTGRSITKKFGGLN